MVVGLDIKFKYDNLLVDPVDSGFALSSSTKNLALDLVPANCLKLISMAMMVIVEEINALGDDFKLKPVEVIRRFLRLFKNPKYEPIIIYTLQSDLKSKTMKDVLGKITAFESYQLGMDDPQPSNLALQADKQESSKSKKSKKKVNTDEEDEDDDECDLKEDLALLTKKMKMFKNKFASKSQGKCYNYGSKNHFVRESPNPKKEAFKSQDSSEEEEQEDPKAKQKKKRFFNKDKSKAKGKTRL
ncbi:hypothetical protein PR202_gb17542 [Eleusine coracana subsp. coracana]|uniref:Uncharacterized protein n=1 Tax=Eleusine coracana subsp. coracana TaxID=191504 RepID=A0AAV5F0X1_ELECO|nr:hypothetical protein PR202_gb17542 [Eleusine coracana subsp. coracana]